MKEVKCLNCGLLQNVEEKNIYKDDEGKFTICKDKDCDSSFDIE